MSSRLDQAIVAYTHERTEDRLRSLNQTFLVEELLVPVSGPIQRIGPDSVDVPVICVRTDDGIGAIPVFTTTEHLYEWKPEGCQHAVLSGRKILKMAVGMSDISEIVVNLNGVPRGRIPRSDFENMLAT